MVDGKKKRFFLGLKAYHKAPKSVFGLPLNQSLLYYDDPVRPSDHTPVDTTTLNQEPQAIVAMPSRDRVINELRERIDHLDKTVSVLTSKQQDMERDMIRKEAEMNALREELNDLRPALKKRKKGNLDDQPSSQEIEVFEISV